MNKIVGLIRLILSCAVFLRAFIAVHGQDDGGKRVAKSKLPPVTYHKNVLPILVSNCNPCHFPGGKVYDVYPFDDQKTVSTLGKKLFTRIKYEKQQADITAWLNTVSPDSSTLRSGKKY